SIEKILERLEGRGPLPSETVSLASSQRVLPAGSPSSCVSDGLEGQTSRHPLNLTQDQPPLQEERAQELHSPEARNWAGFFKELQSKKPQLASILAQASSSDFSKDQVTIQFPEKSLSMEMLREAARKAQLLDQIEQYFGRPLKLVIESGVPSETITTGGVVEEAIALFQPSSLTTIRPS
ncbi:MAG: hypothetical protein HYY44_07760, partial [Deltaproteobacteria bacterium]|nr:hypothetical protein [Deltaproteobacteria bacterium]